MPRTDPARPARNAGPRTKTTSSKRPSGIGDGRGLSRGKSLRASLPEEDFDARNVRLRAVRVREALRGDADLLHPRVRHVPVPDDLRDVDGPADRLPAGLDDHVLGSDVELAHDREDVVHHRLLPDVHGVVLDLLQSELPPRGGAAPS